MAGNNSLWSRRMRLVTLCPRFFLCTVSAIQIYFNPPRFLLSSNHGNYWLMLTSTDTLVVPYKSPFNTLIWQYGWLDSGGEAFAGLQLNGSISVASDVIGLNLTVTQEKDAIFAINAGLVTQVEAANGYLWIVNRWLDPLYQAFGPIDRFGTPEWPWYLAMDKTRFLKGMLECFSSPPYRFVLHAVTLWKQMLWLLFMETYTGLSKSNRSRIDRILISLLWLA